jgi:hypothetical protein
MAFEKEYHRETNKSDREELEQEHRIVERVVAAMAVLAEKLHSGKRFRRQSLVSIARGTVLVADLQQTSQAYLQAPDTDKEALIATLHRLVHSILHISGRRTTCSFR